MEPIPTRIRPNDTAIDYRRSKIMDLVNNSHTLTYEQPTKIAAELEMNVVTVKNDISAIKSRIKERMKGYDTIGLIEKSIEKRDRLQAIGEALKKIADDEETPPELKIKAYQAEAKVIHDTFEIESDGITLLVEDMNDSAKKIVQKDSVQK